MTTIASKLSLNNPGIDEMPIEKSKREKSFVWTEGLKLKLEILNQDPNFRKKNGLRKITQISESLGVSRKVCSSALQILNRKKQHTKINLNELREYSVELSIEELSAINIENFLSNKEVEMLLKK